MYVGKAKRLYAVMEEGGLYLFTVRPRYNYSTREYEPSERRSSMFVPSHLICGELPRMENNQLYEVVSTIIISHGRVRREKFEFSERNFTIYHGKEYV